VRAEGCTEMQGFLFSRPLPAHELQLLLQSSRKPRPGEIAATGHGA
jgi:EAL domain-containing protein (putative c-di-GMP-specific phosphodiesterase class I)